jgi:hypothetical protein
MTKKLMEIRSYISVIIYTGHNVLIDEEKAQKIGIAALVRAHAGRTQRGGKDRKYLAGLFCQDFWWKGLCQQHFHLQPLTMNLGAYK